MSIEKELDQKTSTDHAETKANLDFSEIMQDRRPFPIPRPTPGPTTGMFENVIMQLDAKNVADDLQENKELDNVDDTFEKYDKKGKGDDFENLVNKELKKDGSELRVNESHTDKGKFRYHNLELTENGKVIDEDGWKDSRRSIKDLPHKLPIDKRNFPKT